MAIKGRSEGGPRLLILGPVELVDACGPPPGRSRAQLEEMCAWLLEHPRCTPRQLAQGLALAAGTQRSNLSRLRTWLGEDADGRPYLPRAYAGLIAFDRVTSDWGRARALLAPNVAHATTNALREALGLVRGPALCDVDWPWAAGIRADANRIIAQAALELAGRACAAGDQPLAHWSLRQGLAACPESEEIRSRWDSAPVPDDERQ